MTSSLGTHPRICSLGGPEHILKERSCKFSCFRYTDVESSWKELLPSKGQKFISYRHLNTRKNWSIFSAATGDAKDPDDSEDSNKPTESETGSVNSEILRNNLERIIGRDDSAFSGIDLAALIRNKYGRSYDVQLIKKEFMGKNLLALNVMWKYREQRSFPLTEEEYLLRLDDVANTLKCWGAVSHVRNSLEKLKERPRIGKAVSIFIDMDESGGRANEWIYK
ncbi:uncharacterized protein LOC107770239 [Nicotiana tabacum]|uniref:Uncharacterized protein LOC107770239 n=1 Tax=Nicotiana tabacum TaxID=4097 RepID=A0A1S3XZ78_TOBAC|nr:uncharacterized protein LOC104109355 [Nicotiana tomentosiformis]XP_016445007.1 PREDICTED: uncharacterized protein LOC107770239 isoform X1 [Nicotiana tabacum]